MSVPRGRPIGHPVAWSSGRPSSQVSGSGEASASPKLRRSTSSSLVLRRGWSRREAAIGESLSERDWAVLRSVAEHRFLVTRQVEQWHFHDHGSPLAGARAARRVLRRLAGARVLDPLARRVGGVRAGSASYVWRVGPLGHRLLRSRDLGPLTKRPPSEPGLRFLEHCLAVADVHLQLLTAEREGHVLLGRVQVEPACWRSYAGIGGERLTLKPDLFAITTIGGYEDHWFIEVDRGTESLPTLLTQCQRYEAYRRSGREQAMNDVFPLVVWIVLDEARQARLRKAITGASALDEALFRVVVPDDLVALLSGGVT